MTAEPAKMPNKTALRRGCVRSEIRFGSLPSLIGYTFVMQLESSLTRLTPERAGGLVLRARHDRP